MSEPKKIGTGGNTIEHEGRNALIHNPKEGSEIKIERADLGEAIEALTKIAHDEGVTVPATRRRLPRTRSGRTYRFVILATELGEPIRVKCYVTSGEYADGTVGEIFVKIDKPGFAISGFTDSWAMAVSFLLQTGTPLRAIVAKGRYMKYEPSGRIEGLGELFAHSPIDHVCYWLGETYLAS